MLETVFILENKLFYFLFVFPRVLGYTVPKMLVIPWKRTLLNFLIFLYVYKLYSIFFFFLEEFCLHLVCKNKFIIKTSVHTMHSNVMGFSFSLRCKTHRKRFCSEVMYCQKRVLYQY